MDAVRRQMAGGGGRSSAFAVRREFAGGNERGPE
jgi:hypothetical protein